MVSKAETEATEKLKLQLVKDKTKLGELVPEVKQVKQYAPKRLDLACGQHKQKGYKGIDIAGDADIVHDLFKVPWPIKSGVVEAVFCSHFLEHIPHDIGIGKDGFFAFMDEVYRILKPGGIARFMHPYVWNDRAFWDPTHVRFIHEANYNYLNKEWRTSQGLDHYDVDCDFEIVTISFGYFTDELRLKPEAYQDWARTHLKNAIGDLDVVLRKN